LVCCGHEYTASNARFALAKDPENEALKARAAEVADLRATNQPTIPVSLGAERATNPFLRAKDAAALGELRAQKDKF
jgi:hydroxyacylglutathione hydrolase